MKLIKSLLVAAFALALVAGTVMAEEGKKEGKKEGAKKSCCEKAKAAGKDCTHKCCVEAKKEGKKCEHCNPKAEDKK